MSHLTISQSRCNLLSEPVGIGKEAPRFSWKLHSSQRGAAQSAYQIQVSTCPAFESEPVWDSGKIACAATHLVKYAGTSLKSMAPYFWRVRVWDQHDAPTNWCASSFETGVFETSEWRGKWIEPEREVDPEAVKPAPYLRKEFKLASKAVKRARLYMTAHGLYEASLNGKRIGDLMFMPGYTFYFERLQYQVYDVKDLLSGGDNCLGVILGDGWYRGQINMTSATNNFGEKVGLLSQLRVIYEDGSEEWIVSDGSWQTKTGPIVESLWKDGEKYDARLEMPGWNTAGFDAAGWTNVNEATYSLDNLIPTQGSPIRQKETFKPIEVIHTPTGQTVLDFGQNIAGIVRYKVEGPAGTTVKLVHSEALDQHGHLALDYVTGGAHDDNDKEKRRSPLDRFPKLLQETHYTLKGECVEEYEPRFTIHGFRYISVENYPGELNPDNFTAIAIYSDMGETSSFESSNPKLAQLCKNTLWSQKGNFLDVPTDCPTRERAGWTGDAQVFIRAGSLLMNDAPFFIKWLKDLTTMQREDGLIVNYAPNAPIEKLDPFEVRSLGSAGWADAILIIPWVLYERFGIQSVLEDNYEAMKAWVEYERLHAKDTNPFWAEKRDPAYAEYIWDTNFHFGEWLEPNVLMGPEVMEALRKQSQPQVATAYFANSSRLLGKIAAILGKEKDAETYTRLAEKIKEAYIHEFIEEDGTVNIFPERQASYVRVLEFDLVTDELRAKVLDKLVNLIRKAGTHLGTGFLSTPFICYVLSKNGRLDLAYELLQQETIPSWLYSLTKGATTVWERWNGVNERNVPSHSMNHYSYGAVVSWMFETILGIQPDEEKPGYKHFFLKPQPGGGLTFANGSYDSAHGEIASAWKVMDDGSMQYTFTVPANTTATVTLEGAAGKQVSENGTSLANVEGVSAVTECCSDMKFNLVSGTYQLIVA